MKGYDIKCKDSRETEDLLNSVFKKSDVFVDWTRNVIQILAIPTASKMDIKVMKTEASSVEEFGIPPEMTAEYWDSKENAEVTAYGVRDEYGGL